MNMHFILSRTIFFTLLVSVSLFSAEHLKPTLEMKTVNATLVPFQNDVPMPSFVKQSSREYLSLNGLWKKERVSVDHNNSIADRNDASVMNALTTEAGGREAINYNDAAWEMISLPSPENEIFHYENQKVSPSSYQNGVWYRKRFSMENSAENKSVRLNFLGVNYVADVWLNGEYLGYHEGGYTPFSFDISDVIKTNEENIISLRVDNVPWDRYGNGEIIPYVTVDWRNYAGILRESYLEIADSVHVVRADVKPLDITGNIEIRTVVETKSSSTKNVTLQYRIYEADISGENIKTLFCDSLAGSPITPKEEENLLITGGEIGVLKRRMKVDSPKLWFPSSPNLYLLEIVTMLDGEVCDSYWTQFGIRTLHTENAKIYLNEEPAPYLAGVARHEDSPHRGPSLTNEEIFNDLYQIKYELNANLLRTGHYPNNVHTYLYADRLGLAVYTEIPFVWFDEQQFDNQRLNLFIGKQMWREMNFAVYNSPSTWFLGTSNESGGWPRSRGNFIIDLKEDHKSYDGTRLITQSASGGDPNDMTQEPCDVIGLTLYSTMLSQNIKSVTSSLHTLFPDKPILATEFGYYSQPHNPTNGLEAQVATFKQDMDNFLSQAYWKECVYDSSGYIAGATWWCAYNWYTEITRSNGLNTFGLYHMDRKTAKPIKDTLANKYNDIVNCDEPESVPFAPFNLTATSKANRSIELVWDGVLNADQYIIYRSRKESFEYAEEIGKSNSTTYLDGNLAQGCLYYYWVTAQNSFGESKHSNRASVRAGESARKIFKYAFEDETPRNGWNHGDVLEKNGSRIEWQAGSLHSGQTKDIPTIQDNPYEGNTSLSFQINHAENGVALGKLGCRSDGSGLQPLVTAWDRPYDQTGDISSCNLLQFMIRGDSDSRGIIYLEDKSGNTTKSSRVSLKDYTTVTDSWQKVEIPVQDFNPSGNGLDLSDIRWFVIGSDEQTSSGEWSFEIDNILFKQTMPPHLRPDIPVGFTANAISHEEIILNWKKVDVAEEYHLYRSLTNDTTTAAKVNTTGSEDSTLNDKGLTPEKTYYYWIKSYTTQGGESYFSLVAEATTFNKTPLPDSICAEAISRSEIKITWSEVESATEYLLFRSESSNSSDAIQVKKLAKGETICIDMGLKSNTRYYYWMKIKNSYGTSPFSQEVSAKTFILNPPAAIAAQGISFSEIRVYWDDVQDEEGYYLFRSMVNDTTTAQQIKSTSKNDTIITDGSLSMGQRYYYWVKSHNSDGASPYSSVAMGETSNDEPLKSFKIVYEDDTDLDGVWNWSSYGDHWEAELELINTFFPSTKNPDEVYEGKTAVKVHLTQKNVNGKIRGEISCRADGSGKPPLNQQEKDNGPIDMTEGYDHLIFHAKGDIDATAHIWLIDRNGVETEVISLSNYVSVSESAWRKVEIPLKDFTIPETFNQERTRAVVFGSRPGLPIGEWTFFIDNLHLALKKDENGGLPTPFDLQAIGISKSEISLTWQDLLNESGYTVFMNTENDTGSCTELGKVSSNVTDYKVDNLTEAIQYFFWLKAFNSSEVSAFSLVDSATTLGGIDTVKTPTGVKAQTLSSSEITILWDEVSNAIGYLLFKGTVSDTETLTLIANTGITETEYIVDSLHAETTYFFWVKALFKNDTSGYSLPAEATTFKEEKKSPYRLVLVDTMNNILPNKDTISAGELYSLRVNVYNKNDDQVPEIEKSTKWNCSITENGVSPLSESSGDASTVLVTEAFKQFTVIAQGTDLVDSTLILADTITFYVTAGLPYSLDLMTQETPSSLIENESTAYLTIPSSEKNVVLYAGLRDEFENYVGPANKAIWESNDPSIITVYVDNTNPQKAEILKQSGGKTFIHIHQDGLLNDTAEITTRMAPRLKDAITCDVNGDGDLDIIELLFDSLITPVDYDIQVSTNDFNFQVEDIIGKESKKDSTLQLFIHAEDNPGEQTGLKPTISGTIKTSSGEEVVIASTEVKDRAGPVISQVQFHPRGSDVEKDTLFIRLSEKVDQSTLENSSLNQDILYYSTNGLDNHLEDGDAEYILSNNSDQELKIVFTSSLEKPVLLGQDSLQLSGGISDKDGNIPLDTHIARRAPIAGSSTNNLKIAVFPNPFNSEIRIDSHDDIYTKSGTVSGAVIQIISSKPLQNNGGKISGSIDIFDPVGNCIQKELPLFRSGTYYTYATIWNGRNSNGRLVANGTYLATINGTFESGDSFQKKILIGVLQK